MEPRQDVVDALLQSAIEGSSRSGAFVLANLPESSGIPEMVQAYLDRVGVAYESAPSTCLRIPIEGTVEETERAFSGGLRTDVRRQIRRIQEECGELSFRVLDSKEEALSLLPVLYAMHDKRWLQSGKRGSFADPAARAFFEGLVRGMWGQGLHYSILLCGERIVAFHVGLLWDGHLLYYKPTFEYDLQAFSPGKIHLRYLVEHGVGEGWSGIDLLQGDETYKRAWASDAERTRTMTIRTSSWSMSYWWLTSGREAVERRLGSAYDRWAARIESLRRGAQ
jgi:CelD/BcsL family acetyltransferase involved in cellulose biosynthesis